MRALLLAAGLGTRLRPITDTIPKCLVPIHGTPLLEIWLARVFGAEIDRVVINLHYLPEPVRALVDASPWRSRIHLFDEPVLLGTGGTVRAARDLLGDGPVLVIHADNLSAIDLVSFKAAHLRRPQGTVMTMALFETDAPKTCGIVETNEDGVVTAMHEKVEDPPGTLANAAVYILEPEVLSWLAGVPGEQVDISTQLIPEFLGRIYTYQVAGYHRDIGSPEALAQAHRQVQPDQIAALVASHKEAVHG